MSRYLQHIHVERYGGLTGCDVGPFGPGLNVVVGPNEAGKSTIASLVGGVLFGWESAHGVRNMYRPEQSGSSGRSGRLTWAAAEPNEPLSTGGSDSLERDETSVRGDLSLIDDVDKATFNSYFSLTAEELQSLRSSSDVMARLLAVETGSGASPTAVFVEVERRIANTSVYQVEADFEKAQDRVRKATEQAKLYAQEDRELRELEASRAATAERVSALDAELEDLFAKRAELEAAEARIGQLSAERENLSAELREQVENRESTSDIDRQLPSLDSSAERVLRDQLDELQEERGKIDRAVDIAKENSSTSTAAYEALCELDGNSVAEGRSLRNRSTQAIVSVLLPVAFIAAGIPLFMHGREINSLSFTALGAGLVIIAVFLAFAAFFVLFRPQTEGDGLERRRQDAQWVMLQDRKKLDACLAEQAAFGERVSRTLDAAGLVTAAGSIRQARSLLDEAHDLRVVRLEVDQKVTSLELRLKAIDQELAGLHAACDEVAASAASSVSVAEPGRSGAQVAAWLGTLVKEKTAQREALLDASEGMSRRIGELTRELEFARSNRTLDQAKLECEQLRVRLREAKHELVTLLLAKRMLERSIATWESQSQPEVHAHAGRLLATITGGRWTQVATSPTGSLVAVGADGTARDPRHLSLGTCQQLYLALRIALLVAAKDVGRDIPVLADDILVNFDAERRRGAARALAELAEHRQVIVFTSHEETAAVLLAAVSNATRVDLGQRRPIKTGQGD